MGAACTAEALTRTPYARYAGSFETASDGRCDELSRTIAPYLYIVTRRVTGCVGREGLIIFVAEKNGRQRVTKKSQLHSGHDYLVVGIEIRFP